MKAVDGDDRPAEAEAEAKSENPSQEKPSGGARSRWMMIACCVPMLVIAGVIALSGAGFGFFVLALMCTAMMALMMGAMSVGGGPGRGR